MSPHGFEGERQMTAFARMAAKARNTTSAPCIVELAEKIRSAGISGFVAPPFLNEFDTLARGKTFGGRKYDGEAAKLASALAEKNQVQYAEIYPRLSVMCDTICSDHLVDA